MGLVRTLRIEITGWLPAGLNKMLRSGGKWQTQAVARKRARLEAGLRIRAALRTEFPEPFERCAIRYTRRYARTPLDMDNAAASFKSIGDALQDLGIIPDDSPNHVTELTVAQEKVPTVKDQGVLIELQEKETA